MYDYKIDTSFLPEVWVTWMSKDGRIWMNNQGTRFKNPMHWMRYDEERSVTSWCWRNQDDRIPFGNNYQGRRANKLWVGAGSQLHYAYAKYHADIDRLEMAIVRYDTTRGDGEHTWHYAGDRLFIGKDKTVTDEYGMYKYSCFHMKKGGGTSQAIRDALSMVMRCAESVKLIDEFKKFIGHNYYIIGNGTTVSIECGWHIQKWYDSVQKERSNGKSQKLVDHLVDMPLESSECFKGKYEPKTRENAYYGESEYIKNFIHFERVNDEWSVLRAFVNTDDGDVEELWRAYLGDDGTNRFATMTSGGWIPSNQPKGYRFNRSYYFANEDEAKEKCNRIKYIAPMVSASKGVAALLTALRFPFIEQLYKMGYKDLAISIANEGTPKAHMKNMFGGYYNDKEKNVLRQIAMTKHQLDYYLNAREEHRYGSSDVMKIMRQALGNDLSRVDAEIFKKYLNAIYDIRRDFYGGRYFESMDIDKGKFWKNLVRLNEKNRNTARIIGDTISSYGCLRGERPEINWLFDDYSDVVRTHDAIVALQNQQEAERRAYYSLSQAERQKKDDDKRKKVDEKRKHYEYEDDNFIIRLPYSVNEIVTEGASQRICIGGYTSRHSDGSTNLFFLRRKDNESAPFYAIEMNNEKEIVQIHGSCNKWLGNNPEAIPTVVRWLRKHNIKCDDKILTCTAKGYGRTNEYIEMPVVD